MGETEELSLQKLKGPPEEGRRLEEVQRRLEKIGGAMLAGGFDLRLVGRAGLEGILDLVDFERGFFIACRERSAAVGGAAAGSGDLEVIATRARAAAPAAERWTSVSNPDFAFHHAVTRRAVASLEIVQLGDRLPGGGAEGMDAPERTILCAAFPLCPGSTGVLYLDRSLGRGVPEESDLAAVRAFLRWCTPLLARVWLAVEIASRGTAAAPPASPPAAAEKAGAVSGGGRPAGERRLDGGGLTGVGPAAAEAAETDGIAGAVEIAEAAEEGAALPAAPSSPGPSFHGIVGRDEKLIKLFQVVDKVKDTDLNICIIGESGTGKELLARAIHQASRRHDKLFVAENCGSISENLLESELFGHVKGAFTGADEDHKGLFELANGGTLFLDEIGDMSEGMQRKLLRVLEEGMVRPIGGKHPIRADVRVICASNKDLKGLVRKKTFRADLFYRLNVVTLELPPLRDRPGDLRLLIEHFAAEVAGSEGVTRRFGDGAMRALLEYSWPGNVRELRNVVRRVLLTCPARTIGRKDVVPHLSPGGTSPYSGEGLERDESQLVLRLPARRSFNEIIEECERVVLLNALKECAWNKSKVTQVLKIPRQSLYNKIARYKLERRWGAAPD